MNIGNLLYSRMVYEQLFDIVFLDRRRICGFLTLRKLLTFTKDSVFIPDRIVLTRF
jgi:hypothetical protein